MGEPRVRISIRRTLLTALLTFLATAAGPIYTVRTSAMEPALLEGDHILVPGGDSLAGLRRGDIIAFHFPRDPSVILVKRLISLPGDHLRIVNNSVIVNSKTLIESYVQHLNGDKAAPQFRNFPLEGGEVVVPANRYFVLGDNRDYSDDSRFWGFVEASQIVGLVREVTSSEDPKTRQSRPDRTHLAIQRGTPN